MSLIEKAKSGIVLDGAMSDELENQGVNTNNHLWTATALINQVDKVYQAHMDYFNAGAELVITNTYHVKKQVILKKKRKSLFGMRLKLLKRREMILKRKLANTIMWQEQLELMGHI